jgi:integrase
MRLYKRGDTWWASFYDAAGARQRRSTKCTDRRAAETTAARFERDAADPRRAAANATTLQTALRRLVADRQSRGRADGTVKMYVTKARQLLRVLGEATPLAAVDATAVDRYIETRLGEGTKRNTIGKELTTLRAALKVARRRGEYAGDVAAVLPVGWSNDYKPRAAVVRTAADLQRLVDELRPDRGAHLCLLVATGCRMAESLQVRRSDIDLAAGFVRIRGTKTQAAAASIPVVGWMRPLLEHVLSVLGGSPGPLCQPWRNVGRELPAACARAGLERLTPNDLRRTCSTWLRVQGVSNDDLAGVLRHTDTRMVEKVYGRRAPDALGASLRARLGERSSVACSTPGPCAPPQRLAAGARVGCDTGVPAHRGLADRGGFGGRENPALFVPRDGIEPPTRGFSILCSTN